MKLFQLVHDDTFEAIIIILFGNPPKSGSKLFDVSQYPIDVSRYPILHFIIFSSIPLPLKMCFFSFIQLPLWPYNGFINAAPTYCA